MRTGVLFIFVFLLIRFPSKTQDISFFDYWKYYSDAPNSLYKNHCSMAFELLDKRKAMVNEIESEARWMERQRMVREKLQALVSIFSEKSPLNPTITGQIQMDGYRIEKLYYESQPAYYVTAALYIPDGLTERAPAIFYACGHSLDGFRAATYQHIIINLVKKGFVVLTIDPMGQGERYEYWDVTQNRPVFPIPDHQHSFAGAQCLMTGYSVASYFTWDVIRGIDYLVSRKEVDPDRIGMTGRSGGGNLTAYVSALDDRILASAPECYITDYAYIYKSIGPQCAEQNPYKFIMDGLNHPDFIVARAPNPTLIITTTRDFFSIQGAKESYGEARRIYQAMDSGDKLSMVSDDAIHTSTRKNREAMYAFFQKYLSNPGDPEDMEVFLPDSASLYITETGQTATSLPGETIFSMNEKIAGGKQAELERSRAEDADHPEKIKKAAKDLAGIKIPNEFGNPVFSGRFSDSNRILEKYLLPGSGDYMLPVVYLKPSSTPVKKVILYTDAAGMINSIKRDSLSYALVKKGYGVVMADLPGTGFLGPGFLKGDSYIEGVSYNQWFAAVLAGKSHVGLRAGDLVRIFHFIRNSLEENAAISAISAGPACVDLLHAASLIGDPGEVCLINPFLSFQDILSTRYYHPGYVPWLVAGSAGNYDLPDLVASLSPRRVMIINPRQADGSFASPEKASETYDYPQHVYMKEKKEDKFSLMTAVDGRNAVTEIITWLENQNQINGK